MIFIKNFQQIKHNLLLKLTKTYKIMYLIFFVGLLEHFSYYNLYNIITIYLTNIIQITNTQLTTFVILSNLLIYIIFIISGWLGDYVLGTKRMLTVSMILLIISYSIIATAKYYIFPIFIGILFYEISNILFRVNFLAFLSKFYKQNSIHLSKFFLVYYISTNGGYISSIIITPWLTYTYGWHTTFTVSILITLVALTNFIFFEENIKNHGSLPDFIDMKLLKLTTSIIGITLLIISYILIILINTKYTKIILYMLSTNIVILYFYYLLDLKCNVILKILLISLIMIPLLMIYDQIVILITLFIILYKDYLTKHIKLHFQQRSILNVCFIIFNGICLVTLHFYYNKVLPILSQLFISTLLCTIIIILIILLISIIKTYYFIPLYGVIISYFFQSIIELIIFELYLTLIVKLTPRKFIGLGIGLGLFINTYIIIFSKIIINNYISSFINLNLLSVLNIYNIIFFRLGMITIIHLMLIKIIISYVKIFNLEVEN